MLTHKEGLFGRLRVAALLALLFAAPAIHASSPDPDPSWFDIVGSWFVSLLNYDGTQTEPDPGTIQLPGG